MKKERGKKAAIYPEVNDNGAMAARVEEGLPVLDIVQFGREAGFSNEELARLIRIPPRTYARRVAHKARLKATEGERAPRLHRDFPEADFAKFAEHLARVIGLTHGHAAARDDHIGHGRRAPESGP